MVFRTDKRNGYIVRAGCLASAVALVTAAAGAAAGPAAAGTGRHRAGGADD